MASVGEQTKPNEKQPLVGVVSVNVCGKRESRGDRGRSARLYSRIYRQELLLFLPSSMSIVLTELSGLRSRPITSQKIW
jgi:hypothetical protein